MGRYKTNLEGRKYKARGGRLFVSFMLGCAHSNLFAGLTIFVSQMVRKKDFFE